MLIKKCEIPNPSNDNETETTINNGKSSESQMRMSDTTGELRVNITNERNEPIENAKVSISYTGEPDSTIEELSTDSSGQTETVDLEAPDVSLSLKESNILQPYAEYTLEISAEGYENLNISGAQVFATRTAIQNVRLKTSNVTTGENIVIPAHTLFATYPAKISESEIKQTSASGEIVLSRVVIPEYIIVHDGVPADSTAMDYYVNYSDYIKNVASGEIYSTWNEAAIRANVLAIMSFTLNRVYTEWYRNKGYDFTITSSTAYDQKWSYGRTIYSNISEIVDEVFNNYLSRPDVKQPILTQYCDGKKVQCPGWMTQWGSEELANQGYKTSEILRYFYGDSLYINSASQISGVPASYPGTELTIGSTGEKVTQIQEQLFRISQSYPAIPKVSVDGIYGNKTAEAVKVFQQVFGLPQTGIVNFATWYKISQIYVGVSRIAEYS